MNRFTTCMIALAALAALLPPSILPSASAQTVQTIEAWYPYSYAFGYCDWYSNGVTTLRVTLADASTYRVQMDGWDGYSGSAWSADAHRTAGVTQGTWNGLDACGNNFDTIGAVTVHTFDCASGFVAAEFWTASGSHAAYAEGYGACTTTSIPDPNDLLPGTGTVQVDPAGPTILPVTLVGAGTTPVGCVGTAQVTFRNGASVIAPGYHLGGDGCAAPPCDAWRAVSEVQSCVANPLGCCTTLYAATAGPQDYACLRSTFVRVDVNDDGVWDLVVPAATVTNPPC